VKDINLEIIDQSAKSCKEVCDPNLAARNLAGKFAEIALKTGEELTGLKVIATCSGRRQGSDGRPVCGMEAIMIPESNLGPSIVKVSYSDYL